MSTCIYRRVRRASKFTLEILTQSFSSSSVEKLSTGQWRYSRKFVIFFLLFFFFFFHESQRQFDAQFQMGRFGISRPLCSRYDSFIDMWRRFVRCT
jgi:hypothetical protein